MSKRSVVPALLSVALLTGCGGGDDTPSGSSSPSPSGLAKAEFIAQAEKICTEANAHIDAQAAPSSPEQIAPAFAEVVAYAETTTTKLEGLAADQPDKSLLDTIFLTPLRDQVNGLKEYAPKLEAAVAKGEKAFEALPEPTLPDADLKAMKAYGFTDCVTLAEND